MTSKAKYKTKQREELISFFASVPGRHMTAGDICGCFKEKGIHISQATVYRQMEQLVDEGILSKYIIDTNTPACFEYVGKEENCHEDVCFHCKCEKCGKLIHLHCDELIHIGAHLKEEHNFTLDPLRTVFYGICGECASAAAAAE